MRDGGKDSGRKRGRGAARAGGAAIFVLGAAAAGLALGAREEWPRWRPGGADPVAARVLAGSGATPPCPPAGATIAIHGDSHVSGERSGAGAHPFGTVLAGALHRPVTMTLRGTGGDTAEMGERRWAAAAGGASLVILAFGTNDAAPRGLLSAKAPVPLARFTASLARQIEHWQHAGSSVALIAPPPPGSAAMLRRIAPYREAVAQLGAERGIAVFDPAEAFAACKAGPALLTYDALHMTAAGHRCLGEWLARKLCPASP